MQQPPGWGPGGYGPPPGYQQPPKSGPSAGLILAIVFGGLFVLGGGSCALCVCIGAAGRSGHPERSAPTPAPATPGGGLPSDGEYGYVYYSSGDKDPLYLMPTQELAEKWSDAAAAKDTLRMAGMSGLAVKVPGGTRVKAIGGSFLYKRVEVAGGTQRGRSGWLAKDFVHRKL